MTFSFDDGDGEPRGEESPEPLPTSLIPRWLALVVLVALLASAGFSVCSLISPPA